MKFNFHICDDDLYTLKATTKMVKTILNQSKFNGEIVASTDNPYEILNREKGEDINVYFLDIDLSRDINGLDLAKKVREKDPLGYIIFITAYAEYSMLSFKMKLKSFEYLIKPAVYEDFKECIEAIYKDYENIIESQDIKFITITSGYNRIKINIKDIVLVESAGQKLIIYTHNNKYECYHSLKNFIEKANYLEQKTLIQTHRSYALNLHHIEEVNHSKKNVRLTSGLNCPVARTYRKHLEKELVDVNTVS